MPTSDPSKPNGGLRYRHAKVDQKFSDAPGQADGIRLSRWRRRRTTPFGGDFSYTEGNTLIARPNERNWYDPTKSQMIRYWWRRLRARFGRHPVAWIVVDSDEVPTGLLAQAYIMTSEQSEITISSIKRTTTIPVYGDEYREKGILAVEDYEGKRGEGPA